ncbi:cell division protein SepF [Liquorilactobacillus capillatus]|nr:cell division protein SepF [Liquorilactobacillus capillatus]
MALGEKLGRFFGMTDEDEADRIADYYPNSDDDQTNVSRSSKVISLHAKGQEKVEKKIALFEPRIYSDVKVIATRLLNDQAAVVNFQRMDEQQAHRVVDFLTGTVFAIGGEVQRIGEQIFLCTPHGFVVEGNVAADFADNDF